MFQGLDKIVVKVSGNSGAERFLSIADVEKYFWSRVVQTCANVQTAVEFARSGSNLKPVGYLEFVMKGSIFRKF